MANLAHADEDIGEIAEISEIKQNYKFPKLGNSTKVVRIFVIRPGGH
jgi:hypothetical protein